jgi:hypothetical protein
MLKILLGIMYLHITLPYGSHKCEGSEFKSVNNEESGNCGIGSYEAESELNGTATLFRRFLSGVVKSAKVLEIQRYGILNTAG